MTYPRLLKEGTTEEQRLLKSARNDRPSAQTTAQVLTRLGVGLSVATTPNEGSAMRSPASATSSANIAEASLMTSVAPLATPLLSWGKWLGIATVTLGIGLGAVITTTDVRPINPIAGKNVRGEALGRKPVSPPITPRAEVQGTGSLNAPTKAFAVNTASHSVAIASATLPSPLTKTPTTKTPLRSANHADNYGLEVRLIDSARQSLNSGDASACLRTLEERSRRIKGRMLEPEATLLRVHALLATGQFAMAERVANGFLERYPEGPLSERIRNAVSRSNDNR
jgi:hypothetical protein